MKQKKEKRFTERMMEYAEDSCRRAIKSEQECFLGLDKFYEKRVSLFKSLREYREFYKKQYFGRKITRIKLHKQELSFGTIDGHIKRIELHKEESVESDNKKDYLSCILSDKISETSIKNIFYNEGFIFLTVDGQIKFNSNSHKTGFSIQSSDYHRGLNFIMSSSREGDIFAFDLICLKPIFKNKIGETTSLKIHEDGNMVLYSDGINACFVDIRSMKTVVKLGENVNSSIFVNRHFLCTASSNLIQAFDLRSLNCVGNILSHAQPISHMESSGELLYTASIGGELCISSPSISTIHNEIKFESIESISVEETSIAVCEENQINVRMPAT